MEYRNLGRCGLKVSELCLGTMQFGWTCDEPTSTTVLDAFIDAGGNFIDTADIYTTWSPKSHGGKTEEILGRWMKAKSNRSSIIMATKVRGEMGPGPLDAGLSRTRILRCCEDSLRRLQTDYIDLYQAHWVDLDTPIDETLRAFDDLVKAGKVRYLGASNFPAWRLMEAEATAARLLLSRFESYQPEYSLMERAAFEIEAMPFCKHYKLGIIPYSPLAGGFLTGKYRRETAAAVTSERAGHVTQKYCNDQGFALIDALESIGQSHEKSITQTALAWMLSNPLITAPIIGANTPHQLNDALAAAAYRLSPEELKTLNDLTNYPKNWRPIWD